MSTQFQLENRPPDPDRLLDAAFDLISDGVILLDETHCIRRLNRAAEALTGWSEHAALGSHWSVVLRIATSADEANEPLSSVEPPEMGEHHVTLMVGDRATRRVHMRFDPIKPERPGDESGSVITLHGDENLLQFALESGQQGIWEWEVGADVFRRHGFWSPNMEAYDLGAELSGPEMMTRFHPSDAPHIRDLLISHLRGDSESLQVEVRLRRINGSYGSFIVKGQAPERDAQGRVKRLVGTFAEITAEKAQERRLQIALENSRQGLWEWEPDEDRVHFSREWYALFGYREGSIRSVREDIPSIVHPDDAPAAYQAVMPMYKGERDDFQLVRRFRHQDGHYITVLERGRVLERNTDGRVTRVVGTHVDISTLKEAEARLIESRRFLETVIDTVPYRIFWKDADSRYLGCNNVLAADVGLASPADIVGKSDDDMPWMEMAEKFREHDRRLLSGEEEKIDVERHITTASGQAIWIETIKVALRGPDGRGIGVLGHWCPINRNKKGLVSSN